MLGAKAILKNVTHCITLVYWKYELVLGIDPVLEIAKGKSLSWRRLP